VISPYTLKLDDFIGNIITVIVGILDCHLEEEVHRRDKAVCELTQVAPKNMKNIENCSMHLCGSQNDIY